MSIWKPEQRRTWLVDEGIAFAHSQRYDQCPSMGGAASSHIGWVAMAHLVGLGPAMLDLARPAIQAIDTAIEREEDIGIDRFAWYDLWTESKAIAQWFLTGQNPGATWSTAFDGRLATRQRYAGEVMRANDLNKWMDALMACGYQAHRFEEAMALYEEAYGSKTVAASRIRTPRHLVYALCARAAGRTSATDAELVAAGHRLLQLNMAEKWLHNGDYHLTALWLQIVHSLANPHLTPAQVMLRAYDDMPTVPRPAFLDSA